jgi:ligand-binding SRPBCC domain-containing protein
MPIINLTTEIDSDINRCFDLARDIGIHILSTEKTNERAIAGRTSGLCEEGDTITWEAKHFGLWQRLTVEMVKVEKPIFFEDRMLKGAFKNMRHEHHFKEVNGKTVMTDKFEYEVPFGSIGELFDNLILKSYMTRFLKTRNRILKSVAEECKV